MDTSFIAIISRTFFMYNKTQNSLQKAIGASYSIIGSLMLFGLGGYWLDKQSEGGDHFWLIVGLVIGVFIGLYQLSKIILKK